MPEQRKEKPIIHKTKSKDTEMNKLLNCAALAALLPFAISCGTSSTPAIERNSAIEKQVESVMSRLSLEDMIGQMIQLDISVFMNGEEVDYQKLEQFIKEYRIGSVLNVPAGRAQTPQKHSELISFIQEVSMREIGVPCLYGLDQNHGASYTAGATIFPQEIGLAASFNRENAVKMGNICAYETRASMVPWTFNPTMDLTVNQSWPRVWESFGEDVFVNAEMGKALGRGYQGDDPNHIDSLHIASCIKHFMAYGACVSGQDRTPSSVNEIDMKGRYFEPFRECLLDGALSLMVNSSNNCGIPFHADGHYLTQWVKEDLGWDGMIITDFRDVDNLWQREYIAEDKKDAIRLAINAGIDMVMEPYDPGFGALLKELVEEGAVPRSRVEDACRRILRLKARLGLFEKPVWDSASYELFACEQFSATALEAAVESEILLKNNGILPLKEGSRILVTGPNSNSMRTLNGGWSYTWQGSGDPYFHEQYNTIYEALVNRFGKSNVMFEEAISYSDNRNEWQAETCTGISKAVAKARQCDVIVCCVGENSYCETPGNITDLNLSANQKMLVRELAATGKPLVLVLNEGRPRIISDIEALASAIVDVLLPGNYGGDALALLLSGDRNFSARLPYTYPSHTNALANYDFRRSQQLPGQGGVYNYDANVDVQWFFGEGLSYTSFEYSDLKLDKQSFGPDDELNFTVTVRNTGDREGSEAVLLFSSDLVASISPEVRRLRQFDKITLAPGESREVRLSIPASRLAFVGADLKWRVEKGGFRFSVGTESLTAECTATKVWENR